MHDAIVGVEDEMASLLVEKGKIDTCEGYPRHIRFSEGLKGSLEFPGEKGILPQDLEMEEYLAMQYFDPPAEAVRSSYGIQDRLKLIDVAFGTGNRSGHDYEWVPTSAVWDDCRAWVLRDRFTEGGGDGWFGDPIFHNNAIAAAWLHVPTMKGWAKEVFANPFGKIFLQQKPEMHADVLLEEKDLQIALTTVELSFQGRGNPSYYVDTERVSAHGEYRVRWGKWSGILRWNISGWVVEEERRQFKRWLYLPATVYRNGCEEVAILGDSGCDKEKWVERSLPKKSVPTDVTGRYAAFFPTKESLIGFCLCHNVYAECVWLGVFAPHDNEPGAHLLAMSEEWAKIAWTEGATPIPAGAITEVPPIDTWERPSDKVEGSYGNRSRFPLGGGMTAHCYGEWEEGKMVYLPCGCNGRPTFHGWLRIQKDRKIRLGGLSVRDVGDPYGAEGGVTVYANGELEIHDEDAVG
ncbi:MAG: hypothetical protein WC495_04630 [Patescibacteria group bacterium]